MDTTLQDFQKILDALDAEKNSPTGLSDLSLQLASLRATVGECAADAEARYAEEVMAALNPRPNDPDPSAKKISVAEAERVADLRTQCLRERLSNRLESIDQAQNAIARRLRVLGVEESQAGKAI